jgi:putative colanic acid biosynthesis UDP-glucose lipid carrier transferase
MNRQFERYLQMTLVVLDLFALNFAYLFCKIVLTIAASLWGVYFQYWTLSVVVWLALAFFLRTYASKAILIFEHFTKRTTQVYFLWIVLLFFYLYMSRELRISRLFIISGMVSFGVGLLVNRFLYLGIKKYFKNSHYLIKKVIILGYNDTAKKLAK